MSTPLDAFLRQYAADDPARMHMPGHKGALHPHDITEVAGADSLYEADGVIRASERRMAAAYGALDTVYSAGGSTLCIQTMLALAARRGRTVLCSRNLHVSAANAMALLDLQPVCLWAADRPDPRLPGKITAAQVDETLRQHPDAAAVYLTAPDYFGQRSDVAAIAAVCRAHDAWLLVDNAHGSHLRFLQPDSHPITLGASFCCDSLHKTLPALTGAAALHSAVLSGDEMKEAMRLFGSTSPSYLILQSIDRTLPDMESGALAAALAVLQTRCEQTKRVFADAGLPSIDGDPTRIVLDANAAGYTGTDLADQLRAAGVEPEYADRAFCVLLPSVCTPARDFERLQAFAEAFVPRNPITLSLPAAPVPQRAVSIREAVLRPAKSLSPQQAIGCIAARSASPCPPGVPALLAGERIDEAMAEYLQQTGVERIEVLI